MNSAKPTETLDTNVLVEFWNDWGKESITKALLDLRDGGRGRNRTAIVGHSCTLAMRP